MRYPRAKATVALAALRGALPGVALVACGSYRRGLATVHDLDVVAVADDADTMLVMGDTIKAAVPDLAGGCRILRGNVAGVPADVYLCTVAEAGAMVLFLTGSAEFNVYCRRLALGLGMTLNQYGLTDRTTGETAEHASEADILNALGLGWVSPAERSVECAAWQAVASV